MSCVCNDDTHTKNIILKRKINFVLAFNIMAYPLYEKCAADAKAEGETQKTTAESFIKVLTQLFDFLKDLNNYAASESCDGVHPVSPFLITIASTAMNSFGGYGEMTNTVIDTFVERAIDYVEPIRRRNIPEFTKSAHQIFEGIPKPVLDTIVNLVNNDLIPEESIHDVFEFVDKLLKIALKREVMKGENSNITKEKIEVALKTVG